jgi:hypothetical protein
MLPVPTTNRRPVQVAERSLPPARWLGEAEAPDEAAAIEKAAAALKVPVNRLMAIRR